MHVCILCSARHWCIVTQRVNEVTCTVYIKPDLFAGFHYNVPCTRIHNMSTCTVHWYDQNDVVMWTFELLEAADILFLLAVNRIRLLN